MHIFILLLLFCAPTAYAAGGGVEFISYYDLIFENILGITDEHIVHDWKVVLGSLVSFSIILVMGLYYKKKTLASINQLPTSGFSLKTLLDMVLDFIMSLVEDIIGKDKAENFIGILAAVFIFILVSNLTGLVPGFTPATESISTNLALALSVFVVYNVAGIKEHGSQYVHQFLGPVWWLIPLFILIEVISHLARPVSLSLRLYGNIFGDHLVLSVFTGLTYLVFPAFLLFFGLLVACVQSFVFTLLSSIYISLAVSHDH